jgi:hypothetical protein
VPRSDPTNENRPKSVGESSGSGGLGLAAVLTVLAIAGIVGFTVVTNDPSEVFDPDSPFDDARPTGAGSLPDGDAGISDGVPSENADGTGVIEPGAPTEATPAPLLDRSDSAEPGAMTGGTRQNPNADGG